MSFETREHGEENALEGKILKRKNMKRKEHWGKRDERGRYWGWGVGDIGVWKGEVLGGNIGVWEREVLKRGGGGGGGEPLGDGGMARGGHWGGAY